jgi:uncharacterized membrane protein YeaQ/YmgE (transglycosylase-associated protein family)
MGLIWGLIVGGIVGWLASIFMKTNRQMGILANIVVGVIGSALGQWVAGAIGLAAYGTLGSWAVAIAGAMLLIVILKGVGILR